MTPVVTGDVNLAALEDLVRLCVELGKLRRDRDAGTGQDDGARPGAAAAAATARAPARARDALEQAIIGKAVDLLSGPGGLASFLRRRQLGARLGGPSLPLDIGYTETIPAGIRHAVILRDKHCQWPGGCDQPAAACEVHHLGTRPTAARPASRTASCSALPPPDRHPPVGLDPRPEPRRDDHRVEQGQDQGPAQPRAARPSRGEAPGGRHRAASRGPRRHPVLLRIGSAVPERQDASS